MMTMISLPSNIALLSSLGVGSQTSVALVIIQEIQGIEYEIINNAGGTVGSQRFEKIFRKSSSLKLMDVATMYIWRLFGQSESSDDRVDVVKIFVVLEEMEKDSDYHLSNGIGKIYISADYMEASEKFLIGSDLLNLIYYELAHILQWDANGRNGVNVVAVRNGIAAYVAVDSSNGFPRGWVMPGGGNAWYESPNVTGRFFQYVAEHLCSGFVPKLNAKMKDSYEDDYFVQLTRKTVVEAWRLYKHKYTEKYFR